MLLRVEVLATLLSQVWVHPVFLSVEWLFLKCVMYEKLIYSLTHAKDKHQNSKSHKAQSKHTLSPQEDNKSMVYLHRVRCYWATVQCGVCKCNFQLCVVQSCSPPQANALTFTHSDRPKSNCKPLPELMNGTTPNPTSICLYTREGLQQVTHGEK